MKQEDDRPRFPTGDCTVPLIILNVVWAVFLVTVIWAYFKWF